MIVDIVGPGRVPSGSLSASPISTAVTGRSEMTALSNGTKEPGEAQLLADSGPATPADPPRHGRILRMIGTVFSTAYKRNSK